MSTFSSTSTTGSNNNTSSSSSSEKHCAQTQEPKNDSFYGTVVKRTPLLDLLRQQLKKSRLEKMERTLMQRCGSIQVLFENLHDPHNGAACIRTCEGHGIEHVHVVEAFEPFQYSDGVAMSADKWMSIHRYKNLYDAVETLKQQNMTLVAACLDQDAVPIDQIDFTKYARLCLLFGNEERGLSKGIRQLSDIKVYIPMVGFTQSFNLSVSCAMFLYHLKLQGCIQPNLSQEELQELYTKWLVRGSRRAAHLIEKHRFHFPEL
jgi:tRNA (guanosine-2'-O-)-methyltransferase